MEKIVDRGILYDAYGSLLTAHQRKIYEDAVYNDLSLTEIADNEGISKQGVHDLIRRCTKSLEAYEDKLGMVRRSDRIREACESLLALTEGEAHALVEDILKEISDGI